jgi:predicted DNA-binding protein (MmcQ/YjbR family)
MPSLGARAPAGPPGMLSRARYVDGVAVAGSDPTDVREQLLAAALAYPEAHEDHPWGDTVVKVGTKIFVFFSTDGDPNPGIAVKLPESAPAALALPGVARSGYGLGKAGWVDVPLQGDTGDPELLKEWIDESYRAVALKRHVRLLDARPS